MTCKDYNQRMNNAPADHLVLQEAHLGVLEKRAAMRPLSADEKADRQLTEEFLKKSGVDTTRKSVANIFAA